MLGGDYSTDVQLEDMKAKPTDWVKGFVASEVAAPSFAFFRAPAPRLALKLDSSHPVPVSPNQQPDSNCLKR
jgi:hypothetical protein